MRVMGIVLKLSQCGKNSFYRAFTLLPHNAANFSVYSIPIVALITLNVKTI